MTKWDTANVQRSLTTEELIQDMSGQDEVGIKVPIIRLPAKTELSNVLLSSNPWEKRDLDKKLDKLNHLQRRRERTLEWNQRQFFIQQIFDPELRLRFSKKLKENGHDLDPAGGRPRANNANHADHKPRKSSLPSVKNGMGIFAAPLVNTESPRLKQIDRFAKKLGLSDLHNQPKQGQFPEILRKEHTVHFAPCHDVEDDVESVASAATFPRQSFLRVQAPKSSRTPTLSALRRSMSDAFPTEISEPRVLSKSLSLPDIDLHTKNRFYIISPQVNHNALGEASDEEEQDRVICDGEVISRLTRTLPVTLMLKANTNLNAVIDERKQVLKEKSRRSSMRDIFADPRWKRLKSTLEDE